MKAQLRGIALLLFGILLMLFSIVDPLDSDYRRSVPVRVALRAGVRDCRTGSRV